MQFSKRISIYSFVLILLLSFQFGCATIPDGKYDDDRDKGIEKRGNAIFIHPDGTALNHWHAARIYWKGPDGSLEYDKLPEIVVYRGHMSDRLTGTSNGGATTHAFGVKVQGPDSYGRDRGRNILALSGYPGSFLREAGCYGYPIGVINDGDIAGEPGTGAFLAETNTRGEPNEQTRQLLEGRPGFEVGNDCDPRTSRVENDGDRLPDVILGGGERFFLPEGTPLCRDLPTPPPSDDLPLTCAAHTDAVFGSGPDREDGRNLLELASDLGYVIMRTRAEFEAVKARVKNEPDFAPRILGLFGADDIFNDRREEILINAGLLREGADPMPQEGEKFGPDKIGRLVLWGQKFNQYGDEDPNYTFNPPTPAEMTELGLEILKRRSEIERKPFAVVIEIESTDNMPNNNNAIGTLRALKRADDLIGVARRFLKHRDPDTLIITAADSDGSGIQLLNLTPSEDSVPDAPNIGVNSFLNDAGEVEDFQVATDGIEGANTRAFVAEPDMQLRFRPFENLATNVDPVSAGPLVFAIAWSSFSDVSGGILTRAEGRNASLLGRPRPFLKGEPPLSEQFDNSDMYRLVYKTLFGKRLPSSVGVPPKSRP
jgi:alkaline phosphatase